MNTRRKAKVTESKSQDITKYFARYSKDKTFKSQTNLTLPVQLSKPMPTKRRETSPGLTTDQMLEHMLTDGETAAVPARRTSTTPKPAAGKRSSKNKREESADRKAQIEADLERLANERIGTLGEFLTDSSSDENGGEWENDGDNVMNLSQGSARGQFIARTREVIDGTAGGNTDADVLHIDVTFRGNRNLLRAPNVYVVQQEDPASALAGVLCAPFELIFLLAPTHKTRQMLLSEFTRRHGGGADRRFEVEPRRLNAILRFITQTFDGDEALDGRMARESSADGDEDELPLVATDSGPVYGDGSRSETGPPNSTFDAYFPDRFDELSKLAAAIERRRVEAQACPMRPHTRSSPMPPKAVIDWRVNRDSLCFENLKLFVSLLLYLDLSAWKSAKIAALLMHLAIIYVEELAEGIRAKIISTIQMLLDALDVERTDRVVTSFLNALATTSGMDCRALLLFTTGLISARFFTQLRRFHFLGAILRRMRDDELLSGVVVTASSAGESDEMGERDDRFEEPIEPKPQLTAEVHDDLIDLFVMFGEVARLLAARPNDIYVIMQLLGLCVTDSVIRKKPTETLIFMRDLLNDVLKDVNCNRLDGVVLRSMSDLAHRIGIVIQRRRGTYFEMENNAAKRYKYYSTSSSEEDVENGEDEKEDESDSDENRDEFEANDQAPMTSNFQDTVDVDILLLSDGFDEHPF